jgi:hypothetical protein
MKTAEEYWKAFPKHKPAKDVDIAEAMREYAKLYASEAIREKEKMINKLKDRLEKAWQREDIKLKEFDLIMQLSAKDKEKEEYRKKWYKIIEAVCEPHKHQICRECADSNGTCPHDNLSCDPTDRVIERFKMKDKEIEQLREALATVTKEQLHTTVKAQLSGKTEQFKMKQNKKP